MEVQNNAPAFSLITLMTTILSWITLFNAQYFLSFVLTIVGIVSGIFAIRYYYFAGEVKKKQLKQ
jgi:hypothetical protein